MSKYQRLTGALLALTLWGTTLTGNTLAQERRSRVITVTGEGTEQVATSIARVLLGVEVRGETAASVQQEVAQRSSAVVDLLRSRQVERMQTTGIQLQPLYEYREGQQQRLIGYEGTNTISFRTATDRAGELMDLAIQTGATRIDGVQFLAEDVEIDKARQMALQEAAQNAKAKADAVLGSLNLTAREIINIQVQGEGYFPPPYAQNAIVQSRDAGSTPVIGGDQVIRATVTLEISY